MSQILTSRVDATSEDFEFESERDHKRSVRRLATIGLIVLSAIGLIATGYTVHKLVRSVPDVKKKISLKYNGQGSPLEGAFAGATQEECAPYGCLPEANASQNGSGVAVLHMKNFAVVIDTAPVQPTKNGESLTSTKDVALSGKDYDRRNLSGLMNH
jgi:hypothetical protein